MRYRHKASPVAKEIAIVHERSNKAIEALKVGYDRRPIRQKSNICIHPISCSSVQVQYAQVAYVIIHGSFILASVLG